MKKILLVVVTMFFASGLCYGEIERTYKKADENTLKILEVETTQRISEINITIETLRERIASLEEAKTDTLNRYNDNIARLDEKIALIETQIAKAKELGVVEVVPVVK